MGDDREMLHRPLPTVSVVLATYRRRDNLRRVLAPLLADPATTELIVVVDGCRDGSLELLEELARTEPRLKPVFIENRGPSGAIHEGTLAATGEVVLVLADDVVASARLVTGHARHHADRRGIVVQGYTPTPTPHPRRAGQFATFLYSREYERCCREFERDPSTILRALWGMNASLRRDDCRRVPILSPAFPERYHEDREFGIRCLEGGLEGVFDRTLTATHVHARTLHQFLADARRAGAGAAAVQRLHPDVVGPFDVQGFAEGLPAGGRALVRATRHGWVRAGCLALLRALIATAGRARLFGVETAAAKVARRIELTHGALSYLRRPGADAVGDHL